MAVADAIYVYIMCMYEYSGVQVPSGVSHPYTWDTNPERSDYGSRDDPCRLPINAYIFHSPKKSWPDLHISRNIPRNFARIFVTSELSNYLWKYL